MTVERKHGRKFSNKGRSAGRFFSTFITPEAKTALLEYIAERKNAGESINPDSPLITDFTYGGQLVTVNGYRKAWTRLLKKSGLAQKTNYFHILHIHTLRKYFRSNCIGVDASYRERWMGHQGLYLDMSYFKAEENLQLAEYRKAIPHLTIQSTPVEEKKLRSKMLVDFARLQGYDDDQLRKLEDVLARAKDVDEAITEFRHLTHDEKKTSQGTLNKTANGKYNVVKGESELVKYLDNGWSLIQSLSEEKFLMKI